jgi:hypothetical protein
MTTKSTYNKKSAKEKAPLPRCPRIESINVVQFQLHDNGPKPGSGRTQHTMKVEVYCEGRLNLYKPFWARSVGLTAPANILAWAEKAHEEGKVTAEMLELYQTAHDTAVGFMENEDAEWAKMGHIGSRRDGHAIYENQFLLVTKKKGGKIQCLMAIDGNALFTDSFLYDKQWRPGGKRRKFFGFYDPSKMYDAMQREKGMQEEADRRAAMRGASEEKSQPISP